MDRDFRSTHVVLSVLVLGAWGAGCSLINAFGDLVPQKDPLDGSSLLDTGVPDAAEASSSRDSGSADVAVEAGPRGVIVVGGTAVTEAGEQFVLTALDPVTGTELPSAREPMAVAAILYDGSRDIWYIFESYGQDIFPLPTDPYFTLHTRQIDPVTGVWTKLGDAQLPPGMSFTTTAVEDQRVSYIAYGHDDEAGPDADIPVPLLITLDTSNPAKVVQSSSIEVPAFPVALVGTRSSVNAYGITTMCATAPPPEGGSNVAQLTPVQINPAGQDPTVETTIVGSTPTGGQTGFGLVRSGGVDNIVAVTKGQGAAMATVAIYTATPNDPTMAQVGGGVFAMNDSNIKPPAFDECDQPIFLVGTNATPPTVYAVSLNGAMTTTDDGGMVSLTASSLPAGHSGQSLAFEPFTNTVLAPFTQGDNYQLTAFTYTNGQLVPREPPRWVPPMDLRPSLVATRVPVPFTCPAQNGL
jgi:hypothetical protein